VRMICVFFVFTLHFLCLIRMRNIQDTATIALDRYDILYAGDKSDAVVGTGCVVNF
jgi:hypothetical protein